MSPDPSLSVSSIKLSMSIVSSNFSIISRSLSELISEAQLLCQHANAVPKVCRVCTKRKRTRRSLWSGIEELFWGSAESKHLAAPPRQAASTSSFVGVPAQRNESRNHVPVLRTFTCRVSLFFYHLQELLCGRAVYIRCCQQEAGYHCHNVIRY